MERRSFIKNALCLSCLGAIGSGCNFIPSFKNSKFEKYDFVYKSKEELPKKITLEACSLCQLQCPECMKRKFEKEAPKDWLGCLKFSDFKKFVDEYDFEEIELSCSGEIFLNPELDDIIKYAYQKYIKLTASTGVNLNTVSETTLENLIKYQFRKMTIAMDGATAETYKIYRRGGDFNVVMDNIKKINYFKEKYNSEYPRLSWQYIPFGHNEHEIELAKEKAKKLNMNIIFRRNFAPWYSPLKNPRLVEKQTGLKIIDKNNKIPRLYYEDVTKVPCYTLFSAPQIDYNGDLLGCNKALKKKFKANVFKEGFLNALNSPDYIYAKTALTDLSTPEREDAPCFGCQKYKIIKSMKQPLVIET